MFKNMTAEEKGILITRSLMLNTVGAVSRWDSETKEWVTETPIIPNLIGAGSQREESENIFLEILQDYIDEAKAKGLKND